MKPFDNYKNFNNMKLGGGALKINNRDVGYLNGVVTVECGLTSKIVEAGTPQVQVGSIPMEFFYRIKSQFMQISPENYCEAIGVKQDAIKVWDGVEEYDSYWSGVIANQQLLQFRKRGFGTLLSVKLDHGYVVNSVGNEPIFSKEDGTPLVLNTDYLLDENLGEIIAIPGGSITDAMKVRCKYKSIPQAGKEIAFKNSGLIPAQYPIEFVGTDSKSGKEVICYMPKGETSAGKLTVNGDNIWLLDVTLSAVYDEASIDFPMGYVKFAIDA